MSIPAFPEFKPLGIEDQEEVESFFQRFPQETSDYNFANLFIWRRYDHPKLTKINGNLCILLEPEGGTPYFLPPVGENMIAETIEIICDYLKMAPQLRMVPKNFVRRYFYGKKSFCCSLDRDNSDYIYRVSDLIFLRGKKYDGKRNWIKRFLRNFSAEYSPLGKNLLSSGFELIQAWAKGRSSPLLKYELEAIEEGLNNLERLKLIGRAILISKKVEALMIGGKINSEMAVVYIQVANREISGLPQYFHQRFAAEELLSYKYVNWEQDLGIAGLRKAKLSYHPCRMIHKYNVSKKNQKLPTHTS